MSQPSPPPPLYPVPTEQPVPTLDPEIVADDDELAEAVDKYVSLDREARVRLWIITLDQDALQQEIDADTLQFLRRIDALSSERWGGLSVALVTWAFSEGRRYPLPGPGRTT